jgi:signal transduction histidine kinase
MREVSRRLRENDQMAIDDLRLKASELAEAYQQLSEVEIARREFLTTIAHELRTPLMAANGFLQAIRMGALQGEALTNAIDTIQRNLQEVTALTNDILFVQEMDLILPEFKPSDVGSIVSSAVEEQRPNATQNGITFKVSIPQSLPQIQAEAKSLSRAVSAILDNAIKFSPEGGEVQVEVGSDATSIWIRMQDHGVGIPPEVQARIFDRFFHLDQVGKHLFRGVGLGLSIARQVVEQHRGKILVQSQLGQGSTFTILLQR